MSLFSKTPIQHIDYDINPSEWEAATGSTSAKLSFERMKYKNTDKKKEGSIREKPWYVDIPYYLKNVVPDGATFKIVDVEPQIKARFYGKTPEDAKQTFERYHSMIKGNEEKKLQQKLKEIKASKIVKASVAAQQILQQDPTSPRRDITQVLSETENPAALNTESSPLASIQVNSVASSAPRVSKLSAENIAARKAASQTRRLNRQKAKKTPANNTSPLAEQTWTNKNVNSLASQKAMASKAQRALQSPSSVTNPMALQRNRLRAAQASKTATSPSAMRSIGAKQQTSLSGYGPSSGAKAKLQTRKRIVSSNPQIASMQKSLAKQTMPNNNVNSQISTLFD